jgi:hypothetical protein
MATDLIRYSDFRSKSPVIIPILWRLLPLAQAIHGSRLDLLVTMH